MFELIGTVLTGGATGVIGSVIGKLFGFVDYYVEEKKADKDHIRTIEMLRLQNEIGAEENEREMAVAEANADANMRASFLARMAGNKGPDRDSKGKPTRKLLSLQAWGASSSADARKKASAISKRNKSKGTA